MAEILAAGGIDAGQRHVDRKQERALPESHPQLNRLPRHI
jgi:hypothetical protein